MFLNLSFVKEKGTLAPLFQNSEEPISDRLYAEQKELAKEFWKEDIAELYHFQASANNFHYVFTIDSEWNTLGSEWLILSGSVEGKENTAKFETPIEEFIQNIKTEPEIFKGVYFAARPSEFAVISNNGKIRIFFLELTRELEYISEKESGFLAQILFLGVEGVGKSTIIYRLIHGEFSYDIAPTLTPRVLKFLYRDMNIQAVDLSGDNKMRELWHNSCWRPNAFVYVVPGSPEFAAHAESIKEFQKLMRHPCIKDQKKGKSQIPFLFLANKCQANKGISTEQIMEYYPITEAPIDIHVERICALVGYNFDTTFKWLIENIRLVVDN